MRAVEVFHSPIVPGMKKRLLMGALGAFVALPVVEGGFWLRDDGAFPHLNLYQADADLGARLQPNATMRLRVTTNAVTTVNAIGWNILPSTPANAKMGR